MAKDKNSLNQLIADRGFRKNAIAEDLGIVPSALSHKLKGRRRFTPEELAQLAETLDVNLRVVRRAHARQFAKPKKL